MKPIDHTLDYLRESLANYAEDDMGRQIIKKLESRHFSGEGAFVKALTDDEMVYLDRILDREIHYAKNVQNDIRVKELNEVHELLF
ncbi:sigma-G-dependent sporulation-specific acid-soluble spore protein CsgA [Lentibacillus daqui]|uniref:sigma-G-dependent sporulation-specific acid-soluble spore protein CsgA n=1 Tax=Lentibacillus daqui TaxID=2911514 RepID=UPI003F72EB44